MSSDTWNLISLAGLAAMFLGVFVGFAVTLGMLVALNNELPAAERIPTWHAFLKFYSNDVINRYRASHSGGSLNRAIVFCWFLLGAGFVVCLTAHFMAR
jgi:hypothetical protein